MLASRDFWGIAMKGWRISAAAAFAVALGACNPAALFGGGQPQANDGAAADQNTNSQAGQANAADRPAPGDAGVTSSRSLAGLMGGDGGKDPATGAIPASAGGMFSRSDVIGGWADDEFCKTLITLGPDGGFTAHDGSQGRWSLDGDVLTLSGAGGNFSVRIQSIEGGIMTVVQANGSIGRSRRC